MLRWAVIFLIIAIVAALFGFYWHCCGHCCYCEVPVRPLLAAVPDLFYIGYISRQKGPVILRKF